MKILIKLFLRENLYPIIRVCLIIVISIIVFIQPNIIALYIIFSR